MRWGFGDLAARGYKVTGGRASKYGAIKTQGTANGEARTFDSRTGARLAAQLEDDVRAGRIKAWAPEVSIPIGKDENGRAVRYRADAMVVLDIIKGADGEPVMLVRLLDAKRGDHDTDLSRAKRAAMRGHGFPVQVVSL